MKYLFYVFFSCFLSAGIAIAGLNGAGGETAKLNQSAISSNSRHPIQSDLIWKQLRAQIQTRQSKRV